MSDKMIFKKDIGHDAPYTFDFRSAVMGSYGNYTGYLSKYSSAYFLPPNQHLSVYLCFEI